MESLERQRALLPRLLKRHHPDAGNQDLVHGRIPPGRSLEYRADCRKFSAHLVA
jgi:hypothetical protein